MRDWTRHRMARLGLDEQKAHRRSIIARMVRELFTGRTGHGGNPATRRVLFPRQLKEIVAAAFDAGAKSAVDPAIQTPTHTPESAVPASDAQAWPSLAPCPFCDLQPALQPSKPTGGYLFIVCPEESPCRGSTLFIAIRHDQVQEGVAAYNRRAVAHRSAIYEHALRLIANDKDNPEGWATDKQIADHYLAKAEAKPVQTKNRTKDDAKSPPEKTTPKAPTKPDDDDDDRGQTPEPNPEP